MAETVQFKKLEHDKFAHLPVVQGSQLTVKNIYTINGLEVPCRLLHISLHNINFPKISFGNLE